MIDEPFPWEHISSTVRRKFLTEDYLMSKRGETRIDCRQRCFACGILPTFTDMRREIPGKAWMCPEVKPKRERQKAKQEPIPADIIGTDLISSENIK